MERYPVASEVPIFYDPKHPSRSALDRGMPDLMGRTGLLIALALVLFALTLALEVAFVQGYLQPFVSATPASMASFGIAKVVLGRPAAKASVPTARAAIVELFLSRVVMASFFVAPCLHRATSIALIACNSRSSSAILAACRSILRSCFWTSLSSIGGRKWYITVSICPSAEWATRPG